LAYSGARVGEIAQLRAEDVMTVDGVHVLNITPEAGSVKTGQYRHVPLHPHLIEQGFLSVATAKKTGPLFYDPEAATRKTDKASKSLAEKVGQKIRDMVREAGIGPDQVEQPNHAWRHRFKTQARRWKLDTEAAHHIQGHATDSEGQAYGSWPVERLAEEIAKLPPYIVPDLPVTTSPSGAPDGEE
jgi:integrase